MTYPPNCQTPFHEVMLSGQSHTKKQRHSMTRVASLWSVLPGPTCSPLRPARHYRMTAATPGLPLHSAASLRAHVPFCLGLLLVSELTSTQRSQPSLSPAKTPEASFSVSSSEPKENLGSFTSVTLFSCHLLETNLLTSLALPAQPQGPFLG